MNLINFAYGELIMAWRASRSSLRPIMKSAWHRQWC